MALIFEISKPFKAKPFYRRTTYSYNIGWLYFAIRFVPDVHFDPATHDGYSDPDEWVEAKKNPPEYNEHN